MDNTKFINTLAQIKTRTTQRTGKVKPRTMLLGHPVTHQIIVPPNEATQPGMMYVHTQDASGYQAVQQALNDGAVTTYDDTAYNLEVEVGYISGSPVLRILGLGPNALNQTGGASPQQIAQRRAMAVTPQQYQELRITPTTPPSLSINITGGAWRCANTEILTPSQVDWLDLTSNIPGTTGQARYVMIAVGTDSVGIATNGTAFESALEVDPTLHLPVTVNSEAAFVGWVRLENGQTTIEDEHIRPRPDLINVTGIVPLESGGTGLDTSAFEGYVFYNNGVTYEVRIVGQQIAPPDANDDASEGYIVGSEWYTATSAYKCVDNTEGAAVWVEFGGSGGGTMDDFSVAADSGGPITIGDGDTLTHAGGGGLQTSIAGSTVTTTLPDNAVTTAKIADDNVTDTKLRNSAALSVIGRSANSTGDPADIAAAANGQYLGRRSDTVGFYTLQFSDLPSITFLNLTDTPSSYSGQAHRVVAVNAAGTAVEFPSGSSDYIETPGILMIPAPGASGSFSLGSYGYTTSNTFEYMQFLRARGNRTTPTVVNASDRLNYWGFYGYDGDEFIKAAAMEVIVSGTPGNDDMPGAIIFYTTPDGSDTLAESMRIAPDGAISMRRVSITGTTPSGAAALAINSSIAHTTAVALTPALTGSTTQILMQLQGTITPTGTVSNAYGILFIPTISGANSHAITNAFGMFLRIDTGASYTGTITDQYALFISSPTKGHASATFTNLYGLYIQGMTAGGTLNYAIYTNAGIVRIGGNLQHDGSNVGFYGTTAIAKPTVTGSRGGNAALADLLTELANLGLITNSSSA